MVAYRDIFNNTAWLVQRLAAVTTDNRVMFNELMEMKGNIRVIARIRPLVRRLSGNSDCDYGWGGEL
jgi:hypothetical protein